MKKQMWMIVAILLVAAMCATPMAAQQLYGSISGTVTDKNGSVVPNAAITVTNTDTNTVAFSTTSDGNGNYRALNLPPAHYSVTTSAKGFKKESVTNITLSAATPLTINVAMQVGGGNETVEVTANALAVDLRSAETGGTITGEQVKELQIPNRNIVWLIQLVPGVSYGGGDNPYIGNSLPAGTTNTQNQSANGSRNSSNNWTVDGADNVDRGSNQTLLMYPSVDSIQEVKVQTGLYSAESGRAGGAQITSVTKSGTNKLHGSAYEYFRNDYLNANNALNRQLGVPTDRLRYHDFGYTVGGPIMPWKKENNKSFFFFSQEIRRVITYAATTAVVPNAAERLGNFDNTVCTTLNQPGGPGTAYVNIGGIPCQAGATAKTVTINPIAAAYIKNVFGSLPLPPAGSHTIPVSLKSLFNGNQQLVKIDHAFNSKYSAFFRFENDMIPTTEPGGLFTGAALPGVSTTSTNSPGRNYMGRFNAILSPTFLVEVGYAYSFGAILSTPVGSDGTAQSPDVKAAVASALPFGVSLNRIPSLAFTGASSVTGFGQYLDYNRNHNVFGNATKVWGRHSVKFGGSWNKYNKNENTAGNNVGSFGFTTTGVQPIDAANVGILNSAYVSYEQTWANFLRGQASTFSQSSIDVTADMHQNSMEFFGQDEWKIRRNVTLNFGVRYSYFAPPTDGNGELTNFNPALFAATPLNTIVTASNSGNFLTPPTLANPYLNGIVINKQNTGGFGTAANLSPFGSAVGPSKKNNFAPRIGVAWDPWGDGKTSIRAGFGMFYDTTLVGIYEQNIFTNPPFLITPSYTNTLLSTPTAGAVSVTASPKALRGTDIKGKIPYAENWQFGIQHEMPMGVLVDVAYVGAKSTHLLGIVDINQPAPGAYLNPVYGILTAGNTTITSANGLTTRLNAIRPYQGFSAINMVEPIFGSNYSSAQFSVKKRFKGASQISANYTWSHGLTDAQTDRSSSPQNSYNIRADYGPTQFDRRHVFNTSFIYQLPWFSGRNDYKGIMFGNWQFSGIGYAYTGLPLTITDSLTDPAGLALLAGGNSSASARPDLVGDPTGARTNNTLAGSTDTWFNTAAYVRHCTNGVVCDGLPGNEPRGSVRGPGYTKIDFAVAKSFNMREWMKLKITAQAFNVFNHTNPNGVGTAMATTTTFGKITSFRDPRTMQLGARIEF